MLQLKDMLLAPGCGNLQIHVLPDGAHADALCRAAQMLEGEWLQWQHKTCSKLSRQYDNRHSLVYGRWNFRHLAGYANMIIVCQCEDDGKLWLLRGTDFERNSAKSPSTGGLSGKIPET